MTPEQYRLWMSLQPTRDARLAAELQLKLTGSQVEVVSSGTTKVSDASVGEATLLDMGMGEPTASEPHIAPAEQDSVGEASGAMSATQPNADNIQTVKTTLTQTSQPRSRPLSSEYGSLSLNAVRRLKRSITVLLGLMRGASQRCRSMLKAVKRIFGDWTLLITSRLWRNVTKAPLQEVSPAELDQTPIVRRAVLEGTSSGAAEEAAAAPSTPDMDSYQHNYLGWTMPKRTVTLRDHAHASFAVYISYRQLARPDEPRFDMMKGSHKDFGAARKSSIVSSDCHADYMSFFSESRYNGAAVNRFAQTPPANARRVHQYRYSNT